MMRSLRDRLLLGMIVGMLFLLLVFSSVIYTLIRRTLVHQFDQALASTAQTLAAAAEYDFRHDKITIGFGNKIIPEFEEPNHPAYYQFWAEDGAILLRSPSLGMNNLVRFHSVPDKPLFKPLQLTSGRTGRAVSLKFSPDYTLTTQPTDPQKRQNQMVTLVVARDVSELNLQLRSVRELLIITCVGIITLSFLVASFVVRNGLGLLKFLAADIAAISEDDLTARIATHPLPTEMVPVKDRLNDLLARLQDSFNRERQFTANVAHELRTPLAGMRSTLEVTLTRIREIDEYQLSLSDCLNIAKNMQAMMDNLLALAHVDAHQMAFKSNRIKIAGMIDSCWRTYSDIAFDRSISFENQLDPEVACESDSKSLAMVFSNLLENAVEYTDEAGRIWTACHKTDGVVEITVANTGCELSDRQITHVFDCFWRGDSSRTDTGVHCGLGLALVERVVKALGGDAAVELQRGGIFLVKITLPAKRPGFENAENPDIDQKTAKS